MAESDYIPCRECGKFVRFESQAAYGASGCHTGGGSVVYCADHGGQDSYEDPAKKMYRDAMNG